MNRSDTKYLCDLVRARSGVVLSPATAHLAGDRLAPLTRREGHDTIEQLLTAARSRRDERLAWAITEAMTTNETYFFRDKTPFETLRDDVSRIVSAKRPGESLRIWSAAAATGQEAYTIAMVLEDMRDQLGGRPIEILATDICTKSLERGKAGLYSHFEVQRGLPIASLVQHFEKDDAMWRIAPALRENITFKRHNLLDDGAALGVFHIIVCRNVLTDFDPADAAKVLSRIAEHCAPEGTLMLGIDETLTGGTHGFEPIEGQKGVYRRAHVAVSAEAA